MVLSNYLNRGEKTDTMLRVLESAARNMGAYKNLTRAASFPKHSMIKRLSSTDDNPQKLPHLPVPPLDKTLQRYLRSVKPLLTEEQFQKTTCLVEEFKNNEGETLQELLETKAQGMSNWILHWWLNTAYLGFRLPVVVHSSPGLVFPEQKFACSAERMLYIAKVITSALEYKKLIDEDKIPVDKAGTCELDMIQYKRVFGTCRLPVKCRDEMSYNPTSQHIIVAHNNHFFKVAVYGCNGELLSQDQYLDQIKICLENSQQPAEPIGILTSEHRDTWAKAFEHLDTDDQNHENLCEIEKSLFLVCIDGPMTNCNDINRLTTAGKQCIHGGGIKYNSGNRWFDKTMQFVIGEDGINGITYEHAPAEGQPVAVMIDHIFKSITSNDGKKVAPAKDYKKPIKLCFNVTDCTKQYIEHAGCNLQKLIDDFEMANFSFQGYGKEFIKSQRLSPDSFLQMAFQLAFYRTHKIPGAHYESAAVRMFVHGRTETIRSCSLESVEFAKTMLDPWEPIAAKAAAMKEAINAHKKLAGEAGAGMGVDRHLLGLKLTSIEKNLPLPEIFCDIAYSISSHHRVTTSQVALKADGFMCYGPTVNDGYAVCYNPRDHNINFGISCFKNSGETNAYTFRCALEESLFDMQDVLKKVACDPEENAEKKLKSKL